MRGKTPVRRRERCCGQAPPATGKAGKRRAAAAFPPIMPNRRGLKGGAAGIGNSEKGENHGRTNDLATMSSAAETSPDAAESQ